MQSGLVVLCALGISTRAQVITLTNKTVTFTTLEGTIYWNVDLLKADLYGVTWGKGVSGGRVAYTNLADETLGKWRIPGTYVAEGRRLLMEETSRRPQSGAGPLDTALQKQRDEEDVRELVFKTLIYDEAGYQQGYRIYFLSLGQVWTNHSIIHNDPSDAFMKRFVGRTPLVKKASASRYGQGMKVLDEGTGQSGILFTVGDLKWISDVQVEVTCGVFKAGLNSCALRYTVSWKNHQWKVTDKILVSIS